MIRNRSVPTNSILPHIYYDNLAEAAAWLIDVFGFTEYYRIENSNGQLHGIMMHHGDAWVMLKETGDNRSSQAKLGHAAHSLMVFVEDVEKHYHHTKTLGAPIIQELFDTEYGERQYSVQDLEGHLWQFSRHIGDVSPDSYGAKLADFH